MFDLIKYYLWDRILGDHSAVSTVSLNGLLTSEFALRILFVRSSRMISTHLYTLCGITVLQFAGLSKTDLKPYLRD